jgi:hypothetical protein
MRCSIVPAAVNQNFLANLKELGRSEEADRLSKLPPDELLLHGKSILSREQLKDRNK